MTEEAKTENVDTTAAAQQAPAAAELTVTDLSAIKNIIDVASQRGAFKPSEMTVVGQTYTKLEAFLNAVAAQQQQPGAPEGE